jgi:hypothetical protein
MAFLHCLLAPHFENDLPSLVARVATDQTLRERHDMETLRGACMAQPADVSVTIIGRAWSICVHRWAMNRVAMMSPMRGQSKESEDSNSRNAFGHGQLL